MYYFQVLFNKKSPVMNDLKNALKVVFLTLFCTAFATANAQDSTYLAELKQKYAQFDYWLGEWSVYKYGTDTLVGHSRIQSILNGAAIQEHYHAENSKFKGTSLNKYNQNTQQWEQFWVDNSGLSLLIRGNPVDGNMVMENEVSTPKGQIFNRISWMKGEDGTVRQIWEQKKSVEADWKKVFDGHYRKKD